MPEPNVPIRALIRLLLSSAVAVILAAAGGALSPSSASAADWKWGEVNASLDSSLTFSTSLRTQGRDCRLIATVNGGCNSNDDPTSAADTAIQGALLNSDDGNLNFGKGQFFSVLAQATHDVQVDWREFGAFVRFTYFGDALGAQATYPDRTRLKSDARHRDSLLQGGVVGAHFYFLDAYAYASFEAWDRFFDIRVGNQVLNWGESVFTQGGVNTISTLDVTKIRLAGSELRDALLPAPIARLSTTIYDQLSIEAYYQMLWRKNLIDPVGTYFSTSDLVSRGARAQYVPPNSIVIPVGCGDEGTDPFDRPPGCPNNGSALASFPNGLPLLRRSDAHSQGQWGTALRYYLDELETEFALYYIRSHDKFPTVSYRGTNLFNRGYIVEYKNNIDVYGFSLNTVIADIAYGFELSYRPRQPTPIVPDVQGFLTSPVGPTQLDGARRVDRLVAVANMLYVFGPGNAVGGLLVNAIGASDMNFLGELALTHYPQLKGGRSAYAGPLGVSRPDETGGGYQFRVAANYERFLGSTLLVTPALAFRHDVAGITPQGEAAFNEDVMSVGLSLELNYLQRWKGIISYSNSFSGGERNGNTDRDFFGVSISYAL